MDSFRRKYEAQFNKEPTLGAANAYDIIKILVHVYEQTGPDNEAVVNILDNLQRFEGSLGTLDMGENGIVWSPASVKEIRDGKIVSVY